MSEDNQAAVEAAAEDGRDFVTEADLNQAEAPARPEWLPEKFNTPEDLAKSYNELQSKLGTKEEDIRNKLMEEIQSEAFADRPESAGDYQLPEIVDESMAVDNELLQWWSEHAFENGYSQDEFQKGIEMYAQAIGSNQPDLEAEQAKLGDNAEARIDAASAFANKFFPQEALPAIERMCESHEGIIALEAIQEAMKDGNFAQDTQPAAVLGQADADELMARPEYWTDSAEGRILRDQVSKIYQGMHGGR